MLTGATINADTTKRAKAEGAHNLFIEHLKTFELPQELEGLYEEQLKLTYNGLNSQKTEEEKDFKKELEKNESELKIVRKKYALGQIEEELYEEVKKEIETKITSISKNMRNVDGNLSNLNSYIDFSKEMVLNISNYWQSNDLTAKKRIQETAFPEGVIINVKKRVYLTKKVNIVFDISHAVSEGKGEEIKNGNRNFLLPSSKVASAITLSNQLERDLIAVANLAIYLKRFKKLDVK